MNSCSPNRPPRPPRSGGWSASTRASRACVSPGLPPAFSRPQQVGGVEQLGVLLQLARRGRRAGCRPRSITYTRLASPSATVANCSISSTPDARLGDRADRRDQPLHDHRREPERELVDQERTSAGRPAPGRARPSAARRRTASAPRVSSRCSSSGNSSSAYCAAARARPRAAASSVATRGCPRRSAPAAAAGPRARPRRRRARIFSGRRPVSSPLAELAPCRPRAAARRRRASTRLDLPAPLGPSSAVTSPGGISSDTSRTTGAPAAGDGEALDAAAPRPCRDLLRLTRSSSVPR